MNTSQPALVVEGVAKKVVQFDATHARRHTQLGTPVPQVESPSRAPHWNQVREGNESGLLRSRSPAILVEKIDADEESSSGSALQRIRNSQDMSSAPAQPPSYALVQELAAPSLNTTEKPQSISINEDHELRHLHPPGSLPIEPWQSNAPSLSLSRPQSLEVPESYRALVEQDNVEQDNDSNGEPLKWTKPQHLTVASRPTSDRTNRQTGAGQVQDSNPSKLAWQPPKSTNGLFGSETTGQADSRELTGDRAKNKLDDPRHGEDPDSELVKRLVADLPEKENLKIRQARDPDWVTEIRFPLLRYAKQSELALVDAIHAAVQYAPEIEILRTQVGIDRAEIIKQEAGFDWNRFLETNWDERNVPVGSDLDGAVNRLENHTLASSLGLRKQNRYGGQLQIAQDLGIADSNSTFFNPQNQATATLALEYQQPLLQGAGYFVNTSVINIAVANAAVSEEELVAGLQEHVLQVVRAYWDLVSRRGEFVVQKRNYDRALEVAKVVSGRKNLDVSPVQSARAEATLASRRNALLQAEYAVVFAQEQLLRLIFGQCFKQSVDTEVIPVSDMLGPIREFDMDLELQVGLKNRPEVRRALQLIKRTSIEQGVAKNQLLPALGLSMTLSNQGLRGNRGLASAIDDQWNFGDPTYGIGLEYALPVGNRAAKANLRQAELRIRQFQKDFERVLSDVALEVRNAVHSVTLSGKQRKTTSNALTLAAKELDILERRAELLIDGDEVGPLYLENILQAQERLATAELNYLNASSSYALAHFELQRANGGLLRCSPLPVEAAPTKTWAHRLTGHPTQRITPNTSTPSHPTTSQLSGPSTYGSHQGKVPGNVQIPGNMIVPGSSTSEGYVIPESVQVFDRSVPAGSYAPQSNLPHSNLPHSNLPQSVLESPVAEPPASQWTGSGVAPGAGVPTLNTGPSGEVLGAPIQENSTRAMLGPGSPFPLVPERGAGSAGGTSLGEPTAQPPQLFQYQSAPFQPSPQSQPPHFQPQSAPGSWNGSSTTNGTSPSGMSPVVASPQSYLPIAQGPNYSTR